MDRIATFISMVYRGKTLRRIVFNFRLEQWAKSFQGTILDLGAGSHDSLKKWLPGEVIYIPTDISDGDGIQHVDLNKPLPFKEESIDTATLFFSLYILETPIQTLMEIRRVLKKEGRLYVATPLVAPEIPEPHDYVRWTEEGLIRMFKSAGFSNWEIEKSGGRMSSAVILLHPFFIFNTVRLFVFALSLLVDQFTKNIDRHHPAPHSYFCILTK